MGWWSKLIGRRAPVTDGVDAPAPKADGVDGCVAEPGDISLYDAGVMGREFVELLYEKSKLAARIVDLMPEDMTQLPLEIDAGIFNGPAISEAIDEQHGRMLAAHAMIWSRLYGGGALLAFVEDGLASDQPVDFNNITRIAGFAPIHRYELRVAEWDRRADSRIAGLPNYGQPIMYRAQPLDGAAMINGRSLAGLWHRSRVIPWTNIPTLPRHRRYRYDGWSPGELERIIDQLLARAGGMKHLGNLLRSFGFDVVKIQNLRSQLATTAGQAEVAKRLRHLSKSLAITADGVRVVGLDAGGGTATSPAEDMTPMGRPVNGVRELSDAQADDLQQVSDYPASILFGRINAGLGNGEAVGEKQAYHGLLSSKAPRIYIPQMRQMAELICGARSGPTGGIIPPRLRISVPSGWKLPEDIASKTNLEDAQALELDRKHLTPIEIRSDKRLRERYTLGNPEDPQHIAALAALNPPTPDELTFALGVQKQSLGEQVASPESARALLRAVPRLAAIAEEAIPDLTDDAVEVNPATGEPLPPPPPPEKIPLDLLAEADIRRKLLIGRKRIANWVAAGRLKPWTMGNLRRYSEADLMALLKAERHVATNGTPIGDAQDWPAGGLPWRMIRQADESGVSGTGEVVRGLVMRDGSCVSWWLLDTLPPRPIVDACWTNFYSVHIEQHTGNGTLVQQLLPGGDDDEWIDVQDLAKGPSL